MSVEVNIYHDNGGERDESPASFEIPQGVIEIIDFFADRDVHVLACCCIDNEGASVIFDGLKVSKKLDALLFVDLDDSVGANVDVNEGVYLRKGQSLSLVLKNETHRELVLIHNPEEEIFQDSPAPVGVGG